MISLLIFAGLLAVLPNTQAVTDENIYTALEPGQYEVGVRIVHAEDRSRRVRVGSGNMRKTRPIQITIWYPAVHGESPTKMTFADYSGYKVSEFQPERQRSADRAAFVERNRTRLLELAKGKARIEEFFAAETRAVLNAEPVSGKFPLLLYAPSFSESPSDNIALCEYLAGHGYVVASCPSAGPDSRAMTPSADGVQAQAADLAFMLNYMKDFDNADVGNAGTFGYSWGGMANVLFALDAENIKAVASLDGSLAFSDHRALVESIAEFHPERLRVPYFYLGNFHRQFSEDPHDYFFIDAATNAERYGLTLHGLGHGSFSSGFAAILPYFPEEMRPGHDPAQVRAGYTAVCFYVLNFFDAHIKGDTTAKEVFSQTPDSNGFKKGAITLMRW